ncbi:hypothetical protein F3Y22_tig00111213pilonHSYRG00484 [Hibiscus syriacus]|uniref:Phosphomannose isomerase type I catalytic domain-containing protein n=1 Tax=Hibiscus syriacus TaxID=106335 RepID=A0A6A2YV64_HIBSY|nr:hypothetical protein F3Y22_tig00111213pilonHSYRG00484 [Hibiscus syriacus]
MAKANVEKPSFMADDNGECGSLGLKDWILKNLNVLGHKVLSLAKPFSRQAHPDKELAKELHKLKRNLYKDANHKPEMALAITEFRPFVGSLLLSYDYGNDMHDETLIPNHIQNRDIRYLDILPTTFGNPLWFTDDEMLELRETILYRATELRAVATWEVPVPKIYNEQITDLLDPNQRNLQVEWILCYNFGKGLGTAGASNVPTSSVEANAHSQPVSRVLDSEEATSKLQKKLEELHLRSYNIMALTQLKELKAQIQDLLEKGLIRPSISSLGASILFVNKNDKSMSNVTWAHQCPGGIYGLDELSLSPLPGSDCSGVPRRHPRHVVPAYDIRVDPQKIQAIVEWGLPKNVSEEDKVVAYAALQLKPHECYYPTHDLDLATVVHRGEAPGFELRNDGVLYFSGRLCVLVDTQLHSKILHEVHHSLLNSFTNVLLDEKASSWMTCDMVDVWAAPCEKVPLEVETIREKLNLAMSSRPPDNFSPIVPCALLIDPMYKDRKFLPWRGWNNHGKYDAELDHIILPFF